MISPVRTTTRPIRSTTEISLRSENHRVRPKLHLVFPRSLRRQRESVAVSAEELLEDKNGAPTRTRTRDPLITNQVLYQLSYKGSGTALAY